MTRQSALKFASKPKRNHPEQRLQQAIVSLVHVIKMPGVMFHSNVNEGKRGVVDGSNLKRAGMRAGVADLEFIIQGKAHFLEVKAKGQRQSDNQREFEHECTVCGVPYAVADDMDAAISILSGWGAIKPFAKTSPHYAAAA